MPRSNSTGRLGRTAQLPKRNNSRQRGRIVTQIKKLNLPPALQRLVKKKGAR